MEVIVKPFAKLSVYDLWEIYRIRNEVFVVEQQCPYLDVDSYDKEAYHVMFFEGETLLAYARVLPPYTLYEQTSIGRIISRKRRCGLGTKLVQEAIQVAVQTFSATQILVCAQTYARPFYEQLGFSVISEAYMKDGIPHIKMLWQA